MIYISCETDGGFEWQSCEEREVVKKKRPGSRRKRPTHSPDGVDLTLIRWMLSLTPAERLQVLQRNMNALVRLRNAAIVH